MLLFLKRTFRRNSEKGFLKDCLRPGALDTKKENKTWEGMYTPEQGTPESNSSPEKWSKAMGFLTAEDQETACDVGRDRIEMVRDTGEKKKKILEKEIKILV